MSRLAAELERHDLNTGQVEQVSIEIDHRLREVVTNVTEVFLDAPPEREGHGDRSAPGLAADRQGDRAIYRGRLASCVDARREPFVAENPRSRELFARGRR